MQTEEKFEQEIREGVEEELRKEARLEDLLEATLAGEEVTQSHPAQLPGESTQATLTMPITEASAQAMDVDPVTSPKTDA